MANVLLVTHIYPPVIDGGSKVISKIGDYFKSEGHRLLVLTTNCHNSDDFVSPKSLPIDQKLYQSNVIPLPVYKNLRRPIKLVNLIFRTDILKVYQKGPIFKFLPFLLSILKIIKFKPDYIIAGPLPTTIILYANFFRRLTGAKLIINASFHPTDPDFQNRLLINILKSADYLWTLTNYETGYFHKNFNIPISKMINVGNGVDQTFLTKPFKKTNSETASLLFIGSFAAHKGIETLIDAFSILHLHNPKLSLTLAGQPTLYSPVIELKISSLPPHIRSKIKIIKNFPSSQLSTLIDSCSILITPSTQESFGLVMIEVWARHKPVIASNIAPHTELINKSGGGVLFEINNSTDLSQKISKLLTDNKLMEKLSNSGYSYVKKYYTWDKIGKTIWQKISY